MTSPDDEVWFYDPKKPYGVFSNFAQFPFFVDGIKYFTSEAYFQAAKFTGPESTPIDLEYSKLIAAQTTGAKPAILARQVKPRQNYPWAKELWVTIQLFLQKGVQIRPDWEKVKDNVMRVAVYHKFNQNPKIKKMLLDTGSKLLYEHTHRDSYWADGHPVDDPTVHGHGKNMLGKILEEVRYILGGRLHQYLSPRYGSLSLSERDRLQPRPRIPWLIPGLLILADSVLDDERVEALMFKGYQYIVVDGANSSEPVGCRILTTALVANWGTPTDNNKGAIAATIEMSIARGLPTVVPIEHAEIANIALALVYHFKN